MIVCKSAWTSHSPFCDFWGDELQSPPFNLQQMTKPMSQVAKRPLCLTEAKLKSLALRAGVQILKQFWNISADSLAVRAQLQDKAERSCCWVTATSSALLCIDSVACFAGSGAGEPTWLRSYKGRRAECPPACLVVTRALWPSMLLADSGDVLSRRILSQHIFAPVWEEITLQGMRWELNKFEQDVRKHAELRREMSGHKVARWGRERKGSKHCSW